MNKLKHQLIVPLKIILVLLATSVEAITDMNNLPTEIDEWVGKGKWAVIEVWASDCRMCQLSIQHIVNFKASHPDVDIIGLSVDGAEGKSNAQTFIDEQKLTFPNLLSNKTEVDAYLFNTKEKNFIGTPTFLFYNPQGELVTAQAKALTEKELNEFIQSQETQPEIADPC